MPSDSQDESGGPNVLNLSQEETELLFDVIQTALDFEPEGGERRERLEHIRGKVVDQI